MSDSYEKEAKLRKKAADIAAAKPYNAVFGGYTKKGREEVKALDVVANLAEEDAELEKQRREEGLYGKDAGELGPKWKDHFK